MRPRTCDAPSAFEIAGWVRDGRTGSQVAYARLFDRFAPLVHSILLGRFRPAIADELTQECFVTAFDRLGQLNDGEKFGAWIATIARRIRPGTTVHEVDSSELESHPSADSSPEASAEADRMLRIVSNLPEAYREILMLRLVEGMSGPEIAALTGLTAGSVRVNLHRGMRQLRIAADLARDDDEAEWTHE